MRSEVVEAVIVTFNSSKHIAECLDSLTSNGVVPVVVDNGSVDSTLSIIHKTCPQAKVILTGKNLGYGAAINLGFQHTTGKYVILSNPDVVYLDSSVRTMVEFLQRNPSVGVVGPQQIFPDGRWQRSYGDLPGIWTGIKDAIGITTVHNSLRRFSWPTKIDSFPKDVPYVDGGILVIRREAFELSRGFDEEFFFYGEESDLCLRLREANWRVVFYPQALVVHERGGSSAQVDHSERFVRQMVNSQDKLARKYLPPWRAHLYMRLQRVHFQRLALTYRVLAALTPQGHVSEAREKIHIFEAYSRILLEYSKLARL